MDTESRVRTGKIAGKFRQIRRDKLIAKLLTALFVAGCSSAPERLQEVSTASQPGPAEAWSVSETNPRSPTPAVLWNGLIGLRLSRSGTGLDAEGKPLPMFDIDEYDVDGEEKIRALPNPLQFEWTDGSPLFDPRVVRDYAQTLDFRTGVLTTNWREAHGNLGEIRVQSEVALHPQKRMVGVRWTLESEGKTIGPQLRFAFKGSNIGPGAQRIGPKRICDGGSEFRVVERFLPLEGRLVYEVVLSIGRSPQAQWLIEARRPGDYNWAADFGKPELTPRFDEIAAAAKAFFSGPEAPDIEIKGPVEDQQAVRSFLFYLRSAVHPDGQMSVAPMGLSSQTYHGHVFWDADIWVFPALALVEPERASAIPRYRGELFAQAYDNYQTWLKDGRKTGTSEVGAFLDQGQPILGNKYPWESSVTGRETVPGPSRYEDHITGSVFFSQSLAASLDLTDPRYLFEFRYGARDFYENRIEKRPDGEFSLKGTMSPDENHTGDDDLYTNLLAQWCLNGGRFSTSTPLPPTFPTSRDREASGAGGGGGSRARPRMYLPRDETSFLTYEGDPVRSYKQAAAVLAIYPLQFPEAEKQAKVMMERFAGKTSPNGPAMSDSVHALIWARMGEKEKAYETWRKSWQDFTGHPLRLFSEKRSKENTYFVTGAGGCLQTVLYGFLGLRIDERPLPGATWTMPLKNGRTLSLKPNLPLSWKRVVFKNMRVLGKAYTVEATPDGASVRGS